MPRFAPLRQLALAALLSGALAGGCLPHKEPLTPGQLRQRADTDMLDLFARQEPVGERIGLFQAMARAIKYNLDHRVRLMEEAVARGAVELAQLDMLPRLTAAAGYTTRSNSTLSSSYSATTQSDSTDLSTAQERQSVLADLSLVWNVLDFGVSYVQSQQQQDQVLIVQEQKRKSIHNIVQDVRTAYWRAVYAESLLPHMDALLRETQAALARSRQLEKEQAQPPMEALEYQQALLETTRRLWAMRKTLAEAKSALATLMNLKPGTPFHLKEEAAESLEGPPDTIPMDILERFALMNRPELREEDYRERINRLEVRKAMLRLLPGLEFDWSQRFDSNRFLFHQTWSQAGMRLSTGLIQWLTMPTRMQAARTQGELVRTRRMAFSMAALTQLHLALNGYSLARKEYLLTRDLARVHQRKEAHAEAARQAEQGDEMAEIRRRADALAARMQQGLAYAALQESLGRIYLSLGVDPLPAKARSVEVDHLANIMFQRQQHLPTRIMLAVSGKQTVDYWSGEWSPMLDPNGQPSARRIQVREEMMDDMAPLQPEEERPYAVESIAMGEEMGQRDWSVDFWEVVENIPLPRIPTVSQWAFGSGHKPAPAVPAGQGAASAAAPAGGGNAGNRRAGGLDFTGGAPEQGRPLPPAGDLDFTGDATGLGQGRIYH